MDHSWEGLEPNYRTFWVPQPRLWYVDLVLEVWMGTSPTRSLRGLDCSLTKTEARGWLRLERRDPNIDPFKNLQGFRYNSVPLSPSIHRTAGRLWLWGHWSQIWGLFRISRGTDGNVSCWVPVPGWLFTEHGCYRLESSFRALSESIVWRSLVGRPSVVQQLLNWGWKGLKVIHRPLQGPQPGLRSICILPDAWVGVIPPGSLGMWFWWQDQDKWACSWFLRGTELFLGL